MSTHFVSSSWFHRLFWIYNQNISIPDVVNAFVVICLVCLNGSLSMMLIGSHIPVKCSSCFPLSVCKSMEARQFGSWHHLCKSVMILSNMLLLVGFFLFNLVTFFTTLFRLEFRERIGPSFKSFVSPASIQYVPLPYFVLRVLYTSEI